MPTAVIPTVPNDTAWAIMLGGDGVEAGSGLQRPPVPKALGLNREVKARISLIPGRPRAHGFHPSEMMYLCPVLFYMVERAREDLASVDPQKVVDAFAFIRKVVNVKNQSFSPGVKMEFVRGDTIHRDVQYELGVLGKLWGRWRCVSCRAAVGPGWMPRVMRSGIGDSRVMDAAPCLACGGQNLRSKDHAWVYVEPAVRSDKWGIVGHADGDLRVRANNGWWYRYILEVKSINEAGFEGKRGALPYESHVVQASIYGWLMGVDYIQFVYVNKNQVNRWKEFTVPVDFSVIEEVKRKITAVQQARQSRKLPLHARVCPSIRDEKAKACPAVERCWGEKPAPSFWDE